MIDTDKMRAAYATQPLCQNAWTKRDDGSEPTRLCAVSAMVSYAGVQPDLIHKMDEAYPSGQWVQILAVPVLRAEYGMPEHIVSEVVRMFDRAKNEWRGVTAVLDFCERLNRAELHADAIQEDAERFPQHTCVQALGLRMLGLSDVYFGGPHWKAAIVADWYGLELSALDAPPIPVTTSLAPPKGDTMTGQSKFWTAKKSISIPKALAIK